MVLGRYLKTIHSEENYVEVPRQCKVEERFKRDENCRIHAGGAA
jgi:hypothetical protein